MQDGARVLWAIGRAEAETLATRIAGASGGALRLAGQGGGTAACLIWDRPERAAETALAGEDDPHAALEAWCDAAEAALALQVRDRRGTQVFEACAASAALPLVLGRLGLDGAAVEPPAPGPVSPVLALVAAHAVSGHARARRLSGALKAASQPLGNGPTPDGAPPEDSLPLAEVVAAFRADRAALDDLRTTLAEAQVARDTLEATNAAMLAEMDLIEREARAIAAERDAAQARARSATDEAARLMGSRSMKLTAPLRGAAAWLRGH